MNYYEHHIGDYDADTAHLTWAEDMAYSRLLRLYYRREKPIPADFAEACRLVRARTREEKKAVTDVLTEFFSFGDDGWHQARCDSEISDYQIRVEHNRRVGKLGGRPKKQKPGGVPEHNPPGYSLEPEHNPVGSFREPEHNPPQSPDPSINTPIPPRGRRRPKNRDPAEGFAEFYAKYPRHVARAAAERAWSKLDPDEPLRERIMAALVHNGFDYREDGRFIPHPASWLNAQRWDDEPTLLLDEVSEQVNRV